MATPNRTYVSDGQVLERPVDLRSSYSTTDQRYSPPLTARISRSIDNIYNFFGLYFVSLFSVGAIQCSDSRPAASH
jgi:hypothetical protein